MRRLSNLLVALSLAVSLPGMAIAQPIEITILHTNDTHDHLLPYDTRHHKNLGGIARRSTLIKRLKAKHPRTLVLDAGDTFQGTPLFTFFNGAADYDALDRAGYDATTVGNHDLDDGLENLEKQDAHRHFKIISTNLLDPATHQPIFVGSTVYDLEGVKVGVFGVLGDDGLAAVAAKNQQGFLFVSPTKMAQAAADDLRKRSDLVVMLSHSGLDEDLDLAKHVSGIDVIVGGHSHTKVEHPKVVANGSWKTLVLQAFQWGEYLGELDLTVDQGHITRYAGNLLPVTAELPEDPKVAEVVAKYEDQIADRMNAVVGAAPNGLSGDGKYSRDSELGDWTADVMRSAATADIGVMNAGGLRASLQPGPVKVGDIFSIYPFDNALVTIDVDGQLLTQIVTTEAAKAHEAGALQYSNLTFRMEKGQATDIRVGGEPIDPARTYRVATIDYIAQGNDKHVLFTKGQHYQATGQLLRDVVFADIKSHPTIMPPATGRIMIQGEP